jgi:hypothetical protein
MNTLVPVSRSVGLVPASIQEAMRLAEMMATAKLVPAGLQKSPADCLMVIQQAIRWQMDPFAVAQECSVIQGKLMHSGKLVAAVINTNGNLVRRLAFDYTGEGPERTITVSGQLQGEPQPRVIEVILKNAATANVLWTKQPDQQLMYHGARVWARRHVPELMLGVNSPEEMPEKVDDEEVPPPPRRKPARSAPNALLHDPETGEVDDKPEHSAPAPAPAPVSTPATAGAGLTSDELEKYDAELTTAAESGKAALQIAFKKLPDEVQRTLRKGLERLHWPRAVEVDAMGRS